MTSWNLTLFYFFFLFKQTFVFFLDVLGLGLRSIMANLCQIMIHLNALDFNVCRSEEVSFDAQCTISDSMVTVRQNRTKTDV